MNAQQLVEDICFLAEVYGWRLLRNVSARGGNTPRLVFTRSGTKMTVWHESMTVATILTHPHLGKTEMVRKRVTMDLMETLFINPREHTNRGYLKKLRRRYGV